jgi:hypothetical protein
MVARLGLRTDARWPPVRRVALAAGFLSRAAGLAFSLAGSVTYLLAVRATSVHPAVLLLSAAFSKAQRRGLQP